MDGRGWLLRRADRRGGGGLRPGIGGAGKPGNIAALGADVTINYREQDVAKVALQETGGIGGDLIAQSVPATRPFGRLATILAWQGDFTLAYLRNQTLPLEQVGRVHERLDSGHGRRKIVLQVGQTSAG